MVPVALCTAALLVILFFVLWSKRPRRCMELYAEGVEEGNEEINTNNTRVSGELVYQWWVSKATTYPAGAL